MDGIAAEPSYRPPEGGEGTPLLDLDGFTGPLERLLTLARAHEIDLARLSLVVLVDQLAAALHAAPATPLGQKGRWVVMTSWLLELRSRLLLPADPATQQTAEAEAVELRGRLVGLQAMQAHAHWLEDRPQLGRDVFARGQPERVGRSVETDHEVDVVEFLWASLALFDDASDGAATAAIYRPRWFELYPLSETRARILRLLAASTGGQPFDRLLPEAAEAGRADIEPALRRRAAWSSTLIASLELAKQGDLTLAQQDLFTAIYVSPAPAPPPA